jgi:hypothetical protein
MNLKNILLFSALALTTLALPAFACPCDKDKKAASCTKEDGKGCGCSSSECAKDTKCEACNGKETKEVKKDPKKSS